MNPSEVYERAEQEDHELWGYCAPCDAMVPASEDCDCLICGQTVTPPTPEQERAA